MRFKLWKHMLLSLLLPGALALGITLYAIYNIGKISYRVSLIEVADDINLNLLELRRYEKNILLLYEEDNVKKFLQHLEQIKERITAKKAEFLVVMQQESYDSFLNFYHDYKEAARDVVQCVELKKKLLEDIRPLGRAVEKAARRREQALDLRRFEKNYIIYREPRALQEVNRIAGEMISVQPELSSPVRQYLKTFHALANNQTVKDALVEKIRESGRRIETITAEFSARERQAIAATIAASKKLFTMSFVLLLSAIASVVYLLTTKIVGSLQSIERSFKDLAKGDFSHAVELSSANLPEEIRSFVEAYNGTRHRLGTAQTELRFALEKLAEANKELVDRQDELVEARKISAMRMLASEIAHEINNPLSSIAVFLGAFNEDMEADDPRKANVSLMINEVLRCRSVLRELVDFARKEPLSLKEVNPGELVRDAIGVVTVQNQGNKGVVMFTTALGELPEKVTLDPVLIYQALVNILANAYQFSPPGETIDIRGANGDDMFTIAIRDRGVGIPPENLALIFRPFFTTRKDLGGTGLGLAITKKIIERHQGRIQVESRPGEGTVFTIVLPKSQEEHDGQSPGG